MKEYIKKTLPIFTLKDIKEADPEFGVDTISLVETPAIGYNWMAFSDESKNTPMKIGLSVSNKEKQVLSGPLMIADIPILRYNDQYGEHYIMFTKDMIYQIVQKYFKQGNHYKFNIDHNQDQLLEDAYLFESYIIDRERGVNPPIGYETLPNGSWFGSVKIENKQLWEQIKESNVYGFSIEGIFEYEDMTNEEDQEFNSFMRALAKILNVKIKDTYVTRRSGESKDDFMGRCIPKLVGEGYPEDQAAAICYTYMEDQSEIKMESYTDYPEAAVNAAKRALEWRDSHPDQNCGTQVGWARANQLANKEPISEETIARMASFARHQQNKDTPYSEGCGGLMWDAWGGTAGIEWAQRKLEEIRSN